MKVVSVGRSSKLRASTQLIGRRRFDLGSDSEKAGSLLPTALPVRRVTLEETRVTWISSSSIKWWASKEEVSIVDLIVTKSPIVAYHAASSQTVRNDSSKNR